MLFSWHRSVQVIAEISDVIHGIVCAVGVAAFKSLGNAAFAAGALPSTSAAGRLPAHSLRDAASGCVASCLCFFILLSECSFVL